MHVTCCAVIHQVFCAGVRWEPPFAVGCRGPILTFTILSAHLISRPIQTIRMVSGGVNISNRGVLDRSSRGEMPVRSKHIGKLGCLIRIRIRIPVSLFDRFGISSRRQPSDPVTPQLLTEQTHNYIQTVLVVSSFRSNSPPYAQVLSAAFPVVRSQATADCCDVQCCSTVNLRYARHADFGTRIHMQHLRSQCTLWE
jgi:hypothetical protein